jgi:LPXTG-motif cell wall-anchored protein
MKAKRKKMKALPILLFLLLSFETAFTKNKLCNVCTALDAGPGEGWATIYVSPAVTSLTSPPYKVGDKITIEVRIHNYSQVASWQVKLVWDARLINITSSNDVDYAPDHIFPAGTYAPIPTAFGKWNATHWYAMKTAATYGAVEYNGVDAGLMRFNFTIMSIPPKGQKYTCTLWLEPTDTWTCDENVEENDEERIDGYYEMKVIASVYLSPSEIVFNSPPAKEGDVFNVTVRIANFSNVAKLQIKLWFNNTLFNCTSVAIASDFIFRLNESIRYLVWNNDEGYVLVRASTIGFEEYSGEDAGLVKISFAVARVPGTNQNLTCLLNFDATDTWIKNGKDEKIEFFSFNGEYRISSSQSATGYSENLIFIILAVVVVVFVGFLLFLRRKKVCTGKVRPVLPLLG